MSYKRDWRKMLSKIWLQGKVVEDQEDKKDKDKKGSGASLKKGGYQSSSKNKVMSWIPSFNVYKSIRNLTH